MSFILDWRKIINMKCFQWLNYFFTIMCYICYNTALGQVCMQQNHQHTGNSSLIIKNSLAKFINCFMAKKRSHNLPSALKENEILLYVPVNHEYISQNLFARTHGQNTKKFIKRKKKWLYWYIGNCDKFHMICRFVWGSISFLGSSQYQCYPQPQSTFVY